MYTLLLLCLQNLILSGDELVEWFIGLNTASVETDWWMVEN